MLPQDGLISFLPRPRGRRAISLISIADDILAGNCVTRLESTPAGRSFYWQTFDVMLFATVSP